MIASLPLAVIVLFGLLFFLGARAVGGVALLLLGVLLIASYVIGLSALGGVIGVYLKGEL